MILRRITAAAMPLVAALTALTVGSSAAHAQPAPASIPDIGYKAELIGNTIVTTLTDGTFTARGSAVDIQDRAGNTVVTMPLTFRQDGLEFPMPFALREAGRVLELTVVKNIAQAHPVASTYENQRAMNAFASQFGIATAVGGFIGTIVGGLIGLTGIVAGPTVIASVIAGASVGAVIGTIVVGGPTLVIAGIDLIGTLAAAPGTTKWMDSADLE
ncbi:ammonium transporter [Nocardia sp. 004]|uniref:ammonium transporter n=1 Tax=Nocardia sp. 004 TaxID=3385978 RepID=UPI0039A32A0D